MTKDPQTAWFIATVWFSDEEDDVGIRQLVRYQATSAEDYRIRVRDTWPYKFLSFGPVSRSKVQA